MPIAMTKQTAASVATPASGKVALFVNSSTGEPSYKDDTGTSASLKGATGATGGVTSPLTALAIAAGVVAINCSLGNYFTLAANAAMTSFTFSNLPAAGAAQTIMVRITQDGTGSRVATWPASFKWAGGVAGVLSTAAGSVDLLAITTFDQGTTWNATLAKAFG
jgi:hypothetical protein